jgi:TIR domain
MFENDIFISYAIIDNQALNPGEEGWISNVHRMMEVRLSQLIGAKPKIWRDEKLSGNDQLTGILKETVKKSAVMVSILSPRYVQSEWCKMEVKEFYEEGKAKGNLSLKNRSRVFKIVKTKIPYEEHPPEMKDMLGYEFFVVDQATGRPREFNKVYGSEYERMFWAKLDDLAHDIAETLQMIREQGMVTTAGAAPSFGPVKEEGEEKASATATVESSPDKVVFLAETTFDAREFREKIMRELKDRGFRVLPDMVLPTVGPDLESMLREQLPQCKHIIQIIGENYGLVPEAATQSMVEIQNAIAAEVSQQKGIPRLIWLNPDMQHTDERQLKFLDRLRNDTQTHFGAEIFETPLEIFKTSMLEKIEVRQKPVEAKTVKVTSADDAGPKRLYFICDANDLAHTPPIEDIFFNQKMDVILPVFEGEEADIRMDHEENLKTCDAVVIYYGFGNELWLRSKMRDLQKAVGLGREKPLEIKAVLLGEPSSPGKDRFRTHEAMVIKPIDGNWEAALQPFLKKIISNADEGGES